MRECPSTELGPAPHKGWEETLTSRRDGRVNTRKRYAMTSMTSTKLALKTGDNGAMMMRLQGPTKDVRNTVQLLGPAKEVNDSVPHGVENL